MVGERLAGLVRAVQLVRAPAAAQATGAAAVHETSAAQASQPPLPEGWREAVDLAPERRSSGPVVSNGMEVKVIRFDRRKAAAVTIVTHSRDVEAPRRSHEERFTHWPHAHHLQC